MELKNKNKKVKKKKNDAIINLYLIKILRNPIILIYMEKKLKTRITYLGLHWVLSW